MEKRGIVYSYYRRYGQSLDTSFHYDEMRYSIDTLRYKNGDVPVYVYMSPEGAFDNVTHDVRKKHNVHVRYFDNTLKNPHLWKDEQFLSVGFWDLLFHRWNNAINCVLENDLDCVLFIDSDTVFHKDVNVLFNTYNDRSVVWAKPDNSIPLLDLFKIGGAMNDGQFLLSKEVARQLVNNFEEEQSKFVNYLLSYPDERDLPNKHWTSIQFASYMLCQSKGIPVKYFAEDQVMISSEPDTRSIENLILHHYFSGHRFKYLPKDYLDRIR